MKLICPKCKKEFAKNDFQTEEITIATNSLVITENGLRFIAICWGCCTGLLCVYELKQIGENKCKPQKKI